MGKVSTYTPAITAAQIVTGDPFLIVHGGQTKLITKGELDKLYQSNLGWINVKDYGATGDGSTDDTAAIQAACAAASVSSGVVYFPKGVYCYTHLDLSSYAGVFTLRGVQGYQWWGPQTNGESRSRLHCTATDDITGIACHQMQGFAIQDLGFSYVDGFTGTLVHLGFEVEGSSTGSNTVLVKQCHFISDHDGTYQTAFCFLNLNGTVCVYVEDCSFMGAQSLIYGTDNAGGLANVVVIRNCNFERCTVGQITNPSLNWVVSECTFEYTHTGIPAAIVSIQNGVGQVDPPPSIFVQNCFFWDFGSAAICFKQPVGVKWDLHVENCWFWASPFMIAELHGTGTFVFERNISVGSVPIGLATLIDLGSSSTAHKSLVRIVGNWWPSTGDQTNAIINYAGHGPTEINNNSFTGPWTVLSAKLITATDDDISFQVLTTGTYNFKATTSGPTQLRLYEDADSGTNYTALKAPATLAGNVVFALPDSNGTSGWVLQTDGSGITSWVDFLGTVHAFTKQQTFATATLTSSSAHIAWNLDNAQCAKHTLTESTTLDNPTNMKDGGTYTLVLTQHASSAKTLAFGNAYKWPGGAAPTISTGASAVDIFTFISDGTYMNGVCQKAFA